MKSIIALLVTLAVVQAAGGLPWAHRDAAELLPVETVLVWAEDGVKLTATGGLSGSGAELAEAVADLQTGAPGIVYLGQVVRVLATPEALRLLRAQSGWLRLNVAVYETDADTLARIGENLDDAEPILQAIEKQEHPAELRRICNGDVPRRISGEDVRAWGV